MTSDIDKVYTQVENLIYHTCHKFRLRHGGDFLDLLSIAHEAFCKAYHSHNPAKSSMPTWIRNCIWFGLLDHTMRERRRVARYETLEGQDFEHCPVRFYNEPLEKQVSQDAALVIKLALKPPLEVVLAVRKRDKRERPKAKKSVLREYLADLGWCSLRIAESFYEIRDALGG